ncbi:hypothetical protein PG993_007106 [Apiospora rasikravindrae]|uniref:Uncharacterized protein n=1 Tax=Apiospora rasikravindrae TaxID=990691 RepID=A0ABR1SWJ6_9PEZI
MSTGGPPAGIHTSGNKSDRGLVTKLKDAIKPGGSSSTSHQDDSASLPGGAAHESQDRGGGGVLNALKPGSNNMEGSGGSSTLDAAREATQSIKSGASNNMPADARGFKPGMPGGPGTQGVGPSNSTV